MREGGGHVQGPDKTFGNTLRYPPLRGVNVAQAAANLEPKRGKEPMLVERVSGATKFAIFSKEFVRKSWKLIALGYFHNIYNNFIILYI